MSARPFAVGASTRHGSGSLLEEVWHDVDFDWRWSGLGAEG
jgi:hypothetical protein